MNKLQEQLYGIVDYVCTAEPPNVLCDNTCRTCQFAQPIFASDLMFNWNLDLMRLDYYMESLHE